MSVQDRWRVNVMIRHLSLRHRYAIQQRLEQELGIHVGQELILLALYRRGPMLQKDLLTYLSIEPPTLSAVASRLEKRGLIRRDRHPDDGRALVISLTDAGVAMIETIFAIENDVAAKVSEGFDDGELEEFVDMMRRALLNLDGEESAVWTDDIEVT